MKKVTIFKIAVIALFACVGFVACSTEPIETPPEPEPQPDTYTVKLGWAGEILDVSYEPMETRAAGNDLYGIQVYSKAKTAGEGVSWTPYAAGLFDDPDNIVITLQSTNQYRFIATMIRDGKNKVYSLSDGLYYLQPFSEKIALGKFTYDSYIDMGESMKIGQTALRDYAGEAYYIPNVERFYGESIYIPSEETDVQIEMKRTSFGARFVIGGNLAVDGKLEIHIPSLPLFLKLTDGDDELFEIFTFSDVDAAWATNDYIETIDVGLRWTNDNDVVLKDFGIHPITFKCNTTTTIEVNINSTGLNLNIPDSETGDLADGDTVVINNGELVEPDVEMGSDPDDSW